MNLADFASWINDGAIPEQLGSRLEGLEAMTMLDDIRYRLGMNLLAHYEQEIEASLQKVMDLRDDELRAELLRQKRQVEIVRSEWQRNQDHLDRLLKGSVTGMNAPEPVPAAGSGSQRPAGGPA